MVILNRQQRRKIERQLAKIDPRVLAEFERQAFNKGVKAALKVSEESLKLQFGFGKKRLERFRKGIEKTLTGEEGLNGAADNREDK